MCGKHQGCTSIIVETKLKLVEMRHDLNQKAFVA